MSHAHRARTRADFASWLRACAGFDVDRLDGLVVLVRTDFNVPVVGGRIASDFRLVQAVPGLQLLRRLGSRVVILTHLGSTEPVTGWPTLEPVVGRLEELLGAPVRHCTDVIGEAPRRLIASTAPGEVSLLGNVRSRQEETSVSGDVRRRFAEELADPCDLFLHDAFSAAHRHHASTYELATFLPSAPGPLFVRELTALARVFEPGRTSPAATGGSQRVAVLGGAKIEDKLGAVESIAARTDRVLLGGRMAGLFLEAAGRARPSSPSSLVQRASNLMATWPGKVILPVDLVDRDGTVTLPGPRLSYDRVRDIGPATSAIFEAAVADASSVFWNGPLGVYESSGTARATSSFAHALARSSAVRVVGGGDTVAALHGAGLDETAFDHVSTGGGALLGYLADGTLPALVTLVGETDAR